MENSNGQIVDLYLPRKCSATNRLITAKDHAAVQINIANVSDKGIAQKSYKTVTIAGFVRQTGHSDESVNRLTTESGYLKGVWDARE
ncbi:40S ribosomal protein S21 [Tieghemiomyces parasiticus]|uniref:40S ribosomal protein S21 n=1 Tax=Tieghemiomyces parasiticus TaxID=78921 RepID=A0A9W8AK57_9FUNG|nr:40S ribosomal protein S21 [Tieghemiomyces parasiticus]